MRLHAFVLMFVALLVFPSAAQTPSNPVVEHYRAYREALDREDFTAAVREAEQALAASEARDGDGGRTAVLALNLATARLLGGDAAGAVAPANRALALAQAGAPGVDATFAALIVGRGELAASGRPGADRLRAILEDGAALASVPASEIYVAATELGLWASNERDFDTAELAWATAVAHPEGSIYGERYGLGRALTGQGVTLVRRGIGRSGRERVSSWEANEANEILSRAIETLAPLANEDAPGLELTLAQRAFAEALAWREALRMKALADGRRIRDIAQTEGSDGLTEVGPMRLGTPRCLYSLDPTPPPEYPATQVMEGGIAAVVVRFVVDPEGVVQPPVVVAHIGDESFGRAVERVAPLWRLTKREDSPDPCRSGLSLVRTVLFRVG